MITLQVARKTMLLLWLALAAPLLFLALLQVMLAKNGADVADELNALGWLFQLIVPTATVMIAPMTISHHKITSKKEVENRMIYYVGVALIIFYFVCLYSFILLEPYSELPIAKIFLLSSWFLVPIQGILITILSRFFIEDISSDEI
jgi:hypothetical protein